MIRPEVKKVCIFHGVRQPVIGPFVSGRLSSFCNGDSVTRGDLLGEQESKYRDKM